VLRIGRGLIVNVRGEFSMKKIVLLTLFGLLLCCKAYGKLPWAIQKTNNLKVLMKYLDNNISVAVSKDLGRMKELVAKAKKLKPKGKKLSAKEVKEWTMLKANYKSYKEVLNELKAKGKVLARFWKVDSGKQQQIRQMNKKLDKILALLR